MFSTILRQTTTKRGRHVKELSLSFLELKTELKNSYWFVIYCRFCLARLLKVTRSFCIIAACTQDYELKFTR